MMYRPYDMYDIVLKNKIQPTNSPDFLIWKGETQFFKALAKYCVGQKWRYSAYIIYVSWYKNIFEHSNIRPAYTRWT